MSGDASIGVFVLGMHRSGTSATTRAINLLGVPLAKESELTAASPNNPTGFWEVTRLTEFNNRLLHELGGSSLGPPRLEPGWSRRGELDRLRRRGRSLFAKAHSSDRWAWKDPRNCVLFPFWREALDARPVVVLLHRDPAEIGRSLERRQGLSSAMALAAWERYLREALAGARGVPAYVTRYSDLVDAPERWGREVGSFLRDHGLPAEPSGGERIAEFVGASRRAGGRDEPAAAGDAIEMSSPQRELHSTIESLVGRHDSFPPIELPPETDWTEPLLAERRRAEVMRLQMEERMRSLRRRMREARAAQEEAEGRLRDDRGGDPATRARLLPRRGRRAGQDGGALPDFLIIGGQKCGTSSLFRYLGMSPHVQLPAAKEVHFFDMRFDRGLDWYRAQFPAAPAGPLRRRRVLTGEASPYYMFHPLAPRRVKETLPEVRLLALLRNPVHRAVSHYYHEVGNGFEDLPLEAALDQEEERLAGEAERIAAEPGYEGFNHRHFSYQARGVYVDQLKVWRSLFGEDQLLVINSDSLFDSPRREMRRVYEFLGLPGKPPRDLGAFNQRDYPSIPREIETRLTTRFEDPNARLYDFTGRDFGWPAGANGARPASGARRP